MLVIGLIVVFSLLLWRSAAHLSRAATAQAKAETELRNVALFPEENPAPVLRVAESGVLLFANQASRALLAEWGCAVGIRVPEFVQKAISRAQQTASTQEMEIQLENRSLLLRLRPIKERNYVNFYGTDITDWKRAQAALRESEAR